MWPRRFARASQRVTALPPPQPCGGRFRRNWTTLRFRRFTGSTNHCPPTCWKAGASWPCWAARRLPSWPCRWNSPCSRWAGRLRSLRPITAFIARTFSNPESALYERRPASVFLATGWRDLTHRPSLADTREEVGQLVESEFATWATMWGTLHDRLGCQIIQNNFDRPAWRQLSNHESRQPGGFGRYINLVNQALADRAPPYVVIHDLDDLAASVGRNLWGDERFYHHAKMPCPPQHLVDYGFNVASLLAAQMGLTKKCLVLDLDNTLWGGVVGDDGLGGIRLGQGDGEGEAFLAFQRYAKALKQRGILLAVCSKNTEQVAKEVFRKTSRDGPPARRHLLLHGQLERQGGKSPRDRPHTRTSG